MKTINFFYSNVFQCTFFTNKNIDEIQAVYRILISEFKIVFLLKHEIHFTRKGLEDVFQNQGRNKIKHIISG